VIQTYGWDCNLFSILSVSNRAAKGIHEVEPVILWLIGLRQFHYLINVSTHPVLIKTI